MNKAQCPNREERDGGDPRRQVPPFEAVFFMD